MLSLKDGTEAIHNFHKTASQVSESTESVADISAME